MELNCKKTDNGLSIECNNRSFHLTYPGDIWKSYPDSLKEVLFENLAHLLTINLPLVAGIKKLKYNTPSPLFKSFFDTVVINGLPGAVENYSTMSEEVIKQFLETDYEFNGSEACLPSPSYDNSKLDERAIITLSSGKDSLLSLAVCNEIGLNPVGVYINDTVSAIENMIIMRYGKRACEEHGLKFYVVDNEIEKLNDFEFWKKPETCIGYTHMVTSFCLIALPLSHYFKAKYIVEGNQRNMEFKLFTKDGFFTYPSFDQSIKWEKEQDKLVKIMTNNKAGIMSVIEPLSNIAIIRVLHKRYNNFGKYEISCENLYDTKEKRWCHDCSTCARLNIFMKANRINTKTVGFKRDMMSKKDEVHYCLFKGKKVSSYEKSTEARDEQLLAFYMAHRNGEKGYLMDMFKKKFLKEAKSREDELIKNFFSVHEFATVPNNLKNKIFSIYREELNNLF